MCERRANEAWIVWALRQLTERPLPLIVIAVTAGIVYIYNDLSSKLADTNNKIVSILHETAAATAATAEQLAAVRSQLNINTQLILKDRNLDTSNISTLPWLKPTTTTPSVPK